MPLNPRQAKFVAEYLKTGNASEAARRAGYSQKNADVTSARLLVNAGIRAAIDEGQRKAGVTPEIILGELLRIARVDIADAIDQKTGRLKSVHEMPEDLRRAISSIEVEELFEGQGKDREKVGDLYKVKFWDKTRGLELLGKHLKLFTDKIEVEHKLRLRDLVPGLKE